MDKWLITIIKHVLSVASPEIILMLQEQIEQMVQKAKKTNNPWDDVLAGFLQLIVGKPGSKP